MCMACEMFWMAPEEPAPKPMRKVRKAKTSPDDAFACDAPEAIDQKPVKRRAAASQRSARVKSERRP